MSNSVVIENYSAEWPHDFQRLKTVYEQIPGNLILEVHHVGSTSVPGLAAKPVIDIDIIIDSREILPQLLIALEQIGYKHAGDLGIEGREVFLRRSEKTPEDGSNRVWPVHNLYACTKQTTAFLNHIRFRDYLRKNPAKAMEYGELKKELALHYGTEREQYTEKKTAFITAALRELGFDENTLQQIISQNKANK